MSEDELNGMIHALTNDIEQQGTLTDFILPPLRTFPEVDERLLGVVTPWGQPISYTALYGIVLFSLLCALGLLVWMLRSHRTRMVEVR
jgi:hypothetical protein